MKDKKSRKKVTWYLRSRVQDNRNSAIWGLCLTVAIHAAVYFALSFNGFKYIYPPPQEKTLIELGEWEITPPPQEKKGRKPKSELVDKAKPVELVKEAKAQHKGTKENLQQESTIGPQGDVEVPEPPREKPIDRRSLFTAPDNKSNKDTLAAQTARDITAELEAGHALGNIKQGETSGAPNAHVYGRDVIGGLPKPAFNVQENGIVVVDVWVDRNGNVTKAEIGGDNGFGKQTNTTNQTLWAEALKAAKQTHFNMDKNAPESQKGTITYVFNLTK